MAASLIVREFNHRYSKEQFEEAYLLFEKDIDSKGIRGGSKIEL